MIVGVSTDELVYEYKRKYPVIPYNERIEIIKAIRYVDEVVEQENMDKYEAWRRLHFDKYFHGDDWKNTELYKYTEEKFAKRRSRSCLFSVYSRNLIYNYKEFLV